MPVYRSALLKANNLSDVPTPSTARSNIGLGSSATHPTGDFAQTANNLSDVTAATARNNLAAAQRLAATPVKTGNYTAVIGDLVLCDATAGGFAVTLPTTPVVGAKVNVKKLDATTNAVTVTCGGSDLIITGVSTTSATANLAVAEAREFVFDGTSRWIVAVGQTPLGTLDARYDAAGAASAAQAAAIATSVPESIVTAKGDILAATGSGVVARLAVGSNNQVLTADSAQTAGVKWAAASGVPALLTGQYYRVPNLIAMSTSASFGVGTLRAVPFWIPNSLTLDRIGAEVSIIGDVGSKVRLGIYADDGNGRPGALVLDAGTIAGDSASNQQITISQALTGGNYYWFCAVVQIVTTTQPTIRSASTWIPPFTPPIASQPGATNYFGFTVASVTAGLPNPFGTPSIAASAIALYVRIA